MLAQIPNGLSALRFALAAIWVELAMHGHDGRLAFAIVAIVAAGSDFVDGRIARRLGVASGRGRWLDGIADVTFVLAAIFCEAAAGAIPFYIPILIALSFSQYVIDSVVLAPPASGPVRSRLGHWGGIINYALVITLAIAPPPAFPRRNRARPRTADCALLYRCNLGTRMAPLPLALTVGRPMCLFAWGDTHEKKMEVSFPTHRSHGTRNLFASS